jgi:V8-like Glu-specific endopeptidase
MFPGWRCSDGDINTLLNYAGELKMDLLNDKLYFNDNEINVHLYIFEEIKAWFAKNMDKEKIDMNKIMEAYIRINNKTVEETLPKKTKTKRKIKMDINIMGYIRTDEKEYKTGKEKTEWFHYV